MSTDTSTIPGRLRWRCRRGMRELDVLLSGFVERHWTGLSEQDRRTFDELLDTQDPTLLDWMMGRARPEDQRMAVLVERIVAATSERHN